MVGGLRLGVVGVGGLACQKHRVMLKRMKSREFGLLCLQVARYIYTDMHNAWQQSQGQI